MRKFFKLAGEAAFLVALFVVVVVAAFIGNKIADQTPDLGSLKLPALDLSLPENFVFETSADGGYGPGSFKLSTDFSVTTNVPVAGITASPTTLAPAPTPGQTLRNIFGSQANKAGVTEYVIPLGRENTKVCRDDRLKCVNP